MTREVLLRLYVSQTPVVVMVRATLENTFAPVENMGTYGTVTCDNMGQSPIL